MNPLYIQKLYRSLYRAIDKSFPDRLYESRTSDFEIWNDGTVLVDESGEPIVFYHSYESEYGDSHDPRLIYLSKDRDFSEEFGDVTDRYYVKLKNPYYDPDGIIKDDDGNPFMFEGEPTSLGFLDADPEAMEYLEENGYDGGFDEDYEFVVVFDSCNLFRLSD